MAKSLNQTLLMGRLTRDPETRTTQSGKQITTFSIAVDRIGNSEETDFFDITTWDKLAEIVGQYLEKGSKVLVQGRLQLDRWEKDGEKRSKITITATDVTFLDAHSGDGSAKKNSKLSQNQALEESGQLRRRDTVLEVEDIDDKPIDLSDIPF